MKRVVLAVLLLAAVGCGAVLAYRWADEPRQRRRVVFQQPIHLAPGVQVEGAFQPDHEGVVLWVNIERASPRQDLGPLIGGGWPWGDGPAELAVSYEVRSKDAIAQAGELVRDFSGWRWNEGGTAVGLMVADMPAARGQRYDVELRVDRARPELGVLSAWVTVEHGGDWINYAWLDAEIRRALAGMGLVLTVVVVVSFLVVLRHRRHRRATASRAPPHAP